MGYRIMNTIPIPISGACGNGQAGGTTIRSYLIASPKLVVKASVTISKVVETSVITTASALRWLQRQYHRNHRG